MFKRGLAKLGMLAALSAWPVSARLSASEGPATTGPAVVRTARMIGGPHVGITVPMPSNAAPSPSSQPAANSGWAVPQLPDDLAILANRSIFLHGKPAVRLASGVMGGPPPPGLILRGVAKQGESLMALVEDLASNQTKQLHVGDAFGGGKLVAITTDGVDRSLAGKVSHVKVGQPLEGSGGAAGPGIKGGPGPTTQPVIVQDGPPGPMPPVVISEEQVLPTEAPLAAGAKLLPNKE